MGLDDAQRKFKIAIALILILFISSTIFSFTQAESTTSFSPTDQFLVPSTNGGIRFAVNGSYSNATLENGNWKFENLNIKGSTSIGSFLVSAQNSNITIFSFFSSNNATTTLRLRYTVVGDGKQIFNFGQQGATSNGADWTVIKTNNGKSIFLTEGVDYTISHNGTIIVNGATGNFSIAHYNFYNNNLFNSNLPFYERHSVAITTLAITASVVVLATFIAVRNRHNGKKIGKNVLNEINENLSKNKTETR